jgi:flagellar biosynthesis chaperone FliJ
VRIADLFAQVEDASKSAVSSKKVQDLETLVAKLEKFNSQKDAEIREKDLTVQQMRSSLEEKDQVCRLVWCVCVCVFC